MIQSNELMIGNWLEYFTDFGDSLGFRKIKAHEFLAIHDNPKRVKPIPITEEILLKCGFEKDETYVSEEHPWADWVKNDVVISLPYFEFNFESSEIEIKHLHQLQNLYYALTGEELEVRWN